MLRVLAAAAVTALVVGGCGGGTEAGLDPESRVRDAVTDYFRAMGDGDGERVCALITPPSRKELGGSACPEIISTSAKQLDEEDRKALRDAPVDFTTVEITGDRATVHNGEDDDDPLELQQIGGKWLVDETKD